MACGQSLYAVRSGIAECTPNFRAAYEAAETTPRSFGRPPTTTGLPRSEGSNSSSTETKKASMSRWKIVFMVLFRARNGFIERPQQALARRVRPGRIAARPNAGLREFRDLPVFAIGQIPKLHRVVGHEIGPGHFSRVEMPFADHLGPIHRPRPQRMGHHGVG